jgi:predicted dehydrogenase
MEKIGIGIVGCGSRVRGVIKDTISNAQNIEVVALFDPNERAIEATKKACECPDAKVYDNYEELVNAPEVQWVAIGSINAAHKEQVQAALSAKKHIFCEKPLATTLEDCAELSKEIEQSSSLFSMGFVLRYSTFYQRIKEILDEGLIGKLVSFEFNEMLNFNHGAFIMFDWRRKRELSGTHLLEKCCHDFDIANWLVGSIPERAASFGGLDFFKPENEKQIERIGKNDKGQDAYMTWKNYSFYNDEYDSDPFNSDKDIVDNQVVILEYANGVRASFHTNLNCSMTERRFYLCGTEGTIIGDVLTGEIRWQKIGFDSEMQIEKFSGGGHGGADGTLSENLRNCMLEGTVPPVGLQDGLKSAVAVLGCDKAHDTGTVVDLKPMWEKVGIKL